MADARTEFAVAAASAFDVTDAELRGKGFQSLHSFLTDRQRFVFADTILSKNMLNADKNSRVRVDCTFRTGNAFRWAYPTDNDAAVDADDSRVGYATLKYLQGGIKFNEIEDLAVNGGMNQRIVDRFKAKYAAAMMDCATKLDDMFWQKPVNTSDDKTPWGIPTFCRYGNATTTPGFNGGDPSELSGGYLGIASTDESRWQNACAIYSSMSEDDFVQKFNKLLYLTDFIVPMLVDRNKVPGELSQLAVDTERLLVCNWDTFDKAERLRKRLNDNYGNDMTGDRGPGGSQGFATFGGAKLTPCPVMDSTAVIQSGSEPVYGLSFNKNDGIGVVYNEGLWLRKKDPIMDPFNSNSFRIMWDTMANIVCTNRRRNFVIAKSEPIA